MQRMAERDLKDYREHQQQAAQLAAAKRNQRAESQGHAQDSQPRSRR